MKRLLWATAAVAVLAAIIALHYLPGKRSRKENEKIPKRPRESVVFIMGEDSGNGNPFYSKAEDYYRHNTTYLVTTCRSLSEIIDYLVKGSYDNRTPWGSVRIVVHGNEWTGLGIPVVPGGERASAENIIGALDSEVLRPLPYGTADASTEIRLLGCGLGRNTDLTAAINRLFGGSRDIPHRPAIYTSRYFMVYETVWSGNEKTCREYPADFWYAFYRKGYYPGDIRIARQLHRRYPDENIAWREAIDRENPRWRGDTFHRTFNIPAEWTVTYSEPGMRPALPDRDSEKAWIDGQKELKEYLGKTGIPFDCFEWKTRHINVQDDSGTVIPAIKARGDCTVICILRDLSRAGIDN